MFSRASKQFTWNIKHRLSVSKNSYKVIQNQRIELYSRGRCINYSMDKVYLRNPPSTNELHINFRYINENLKIDRDFNLFRKTDEKIDAGIARIKNNLEKELNKKAKKKKSKTSVAVENSEENKSVTEMNVQFRCATLEPLSEITFGELLEKSTKEDLYLHVIDRSYKCVYNQPWVSNIALPSVILSGCLAYPTKLELQFADLDYCIGKWYKTKLPPSSNLERPEVWDLCGEGFLYPVKNEDIGSFLKFVLIPGNEKGEEGPPVEKVTKNAILESPSEYPFEKRHQYTKEKLVGPDFRVVSYNLLADLYSDSEYAQSNLFPYCPKYALNSDYRKQLFLKELLGYNADIICLQEVDTKVFNYDLSPVLGSKIHNFQGIMAEKGSSGEGVATWYRTDRLELLETHNQNIGNGIVSLPFFESIWQSINQNAQLVERASDKATTLQLSLFRLKDVNQLIMVANTHLYFHPDADHIRLLQFGFCMMYIENFFRETLEKYQIEDEQKLGIVFCGDFNSVPECGIYKLMTEGVVGNDFVDWRSKETEAIRGVSLKQPFKMESACGTPEFTNYTHLFAACLDYIFYQKDRFSVKQSVPLPSNEELQQYTAIPSIVFPSDHVALVADLSCLHSK